MLFILLRKCITRRACGSFQVKILIRSVDLSNKLLIPNTDPVYDHYYDTLILPYCKKLPICTADCVVRYCFEFCTELAIYSIQLQLQLQLMG